MPKKKKINKSLKDEFYTYRGEKLTRKQLSRRMSRANTALRKSKEYLTKKEYEYVHKTFMDITREIYGFDNLPYSIKGIHDVQKLRQIEQAVHKTLQSTYLSKSKYNKMRELQTQRLMRTINYDPDNKILTYEQAQRMRDVFSTDIWHHLIENKLYDSSQLIELLASTGWLDSNASVDEAIGLLENVEELAEITNIPIDELLEEELTNAR